MVGFIYCQSIDKDESIDGALTPSILSSHLFYNTVEIKRMNISIKKEMRYPVMLVCFVILFTVEYYRSRQ